MRYLLASLFSITLVFTIPGTAYAYQLFLTCGDTPGFCPNPPDSISYQENGNINDCE